MGQSFVTAGKVIANYMVRHGYIKQGANVFCPVEDPTAAYAGQRAQGVNPVLASVGAHCDVLGVSDSDATARSRMVDYLLGHSNTTVIMALGGIPLANAPAVLKQVGRHIPVAGFDVYDPRIIKGIQSGDIIATVDQQFYSQAFYAVMQLALYLKYGLYPSDMNTGGKGVVDRTNIGILAQLSGIYR
jgi:simple sugar transport system substrate-binding protein